MASVFPESMDKLDSNNVGSSFSIIENYIRYMQERVEFAIRNTTKQVEKTGTSSAEIYILVTALNNSVSSIQSSIHSLSADISGIKSDLASVKKDVSSVKAEFSEFKTEVNSSIDQLSSSVSAMNEAIADLQSRVNALENPTTTP